MSERNLTTRPHCFINPVKDKNGRAYAWKIDFQRSGKVHAQVFDFVEYGGELAALEAAETLRNQLVLKMPLSFTYASRRRLMPNNTSGHAGVYRVQSNQIDYWRATTRIYGYNLSKSFRIDRYGEDEAKQMALLERERQLTLCNDPYDVAMEKLQLHFSQTSRRVRENRIKAAMHKTRDLKPAVEEVANPHQEQVLPISAEQASLSISRHFAASTK